MDPAAATNPALPGVVRPASPGRTARSAQTRTCRVARRTINIAVAIVLLILALPVLLLVAVLVRLSSPGPVIYTQPRVGLDRRRDARVAGEGDGRRQVNHGGRIFQIYKFRTMYMADRPGPQVWARSDDPRVTPVGRVLRKYRLDELPQLINVLKGDMNIVGPRPEQPQIFVQLRQALEHYDERQQVLPGITGQAQINQAYDASLDDVRRKLGHDLDYIRNASATTDLSIMLQTIPVMLFRKGAL